MDMIVLFSNHIIIIRISWFYQRNVRYTLKHLNALSRVDKRKY